MSRHDVLRATWAPGQIWETRIEECAADPNAWVPVAGGGRMEPLWEERQEYRQKPAPVPAPAPALPRPDDVPSIYDVIPPRAHKWLEGYGAAEAAWYEGWDGCRVQCRQRLDAHLQRGRAAPAMAEWQPIETAPKDGTRVILSWGGKSINGFYLDNSQTSHPWAGWRVESLVAQPAGKPTHWQPFPPPYGGQEVPRG